MWSSGSYVVVLLTWPTWMLWPLENRVWAFSDLGCFRSIRKDLFRNDWRPHRGKRELDSTVILANQRVTSAQKCRMSGQNQSISMSQDDRNTKIYAAFDRLENSIHFLLTGGQVHDSWVFYQLLKSFDIYQSNIIADKTYGTAEIHNYIEAEFDAINIIPSRKKPITSGLMIITFIANAIWLRTSSIIWRSIVEFRLVMIGFPPIFF